MQERQVTIGDQTFKLEEPFLVLATQNPIEQEGTYPLPEAQVDRFMLKVIINYPKKEEEKAIIRLNMSGNVIISKLDEPMGKEVAAAGKGIYVRADNSNTALRAVSASLDKLATAPVESKIYSSRDEQFATMACRYQGYHSKQCVGLDGS